MVRSVQVKSRQVERSVRDVLTEPSLGEAQGSRSVKVHVGGVEEQQFVHLVGQRADVSQVKSAKLLLSQSDERTGSLPPVSPAFSAESIDSCCSSDK